MALTEQIDDCRGKEANARTKEFAERVHGWIEEKKGLSDLKSGFIEDLRQQIRDIEEELD